MADYTRCKHAETGHESEIPTDALSAFRKLGWEPIGESRSQDAAEQERIDAENAQAERIAVVEEELTAEKPAPVPVVLEQVGDDPEAARVALDLEQSREKPRTTLVDRLSKITDAAPSGTTQED